MSAIPTPPAMPTMAAMLDWQASCRPAARAFIYLERGERETDSITYAELALRARRVSQVLRDRGLAGRRVILAYPTGIEFIAALFGCFHAGAVAIPAPIDSANRGSTRLQSILDDAQASAVLTLRATLETAAFDREGSSAAHANCIATDEIGHLSVSSAPPVERTALAMLQYTSGSTGTPRGVMLTHDNLMHNQHALCAVLASSAADIGVNWLPLYHDMGLIGGVLHAVYHGGLTILMAPLAFVQWPMRWMQAIHRYRASISMGPAFAYGLVAQRQVRFGAALDLSCWRAAICGGEPIRPKILQQFAGNFRGAGFDPAALMPAYGLAESTLIATAARVGTGLVTVDSAVAAPGAAAGGEAWQRTLVACGPSLPGHRVAIVDPRTSCRVPAGRAGEIWLQGPSIAAGYWNRPEETRTAFEARLVDDRDAGLWLRTGDLGYLGPTGLVVTGRAKEILVIHGVNVDPVDIEAAAGESDAALADGGGAAFSIQREDAEVIVLLLEIRREAAADIQVDAVAGHVIDAVHRCLGLRLFDLVLLQSRTLPRTTSGKIQRHRAKERYLAGRLVPLRAVDHPGLGRCRVHAPS